MSDKPISVVLRSPMSALPAGLPRLRREEVARPPEQRMVVSYVMTAVALGVVALFFNIAVVGEVQHYVAQKRLYATFRETLAAGSVPIGQTDVNGHLVAAGTPVALLDIPSMHIDEVVVEGSSSWQTMKGVGHRRDTPLPGQAGVSVLLGRRATYGGVFANLSRLSPGAPITVTTGQGVAHYRVVGVRSTDTVPPALGPDEGRLTLVTAAGAPYRPDGVLRVDAELVSTAFPRPTPVLGSGAVPTTDEVLQGDTSHVFGLSWLLELLVLGTAAAVWSWKRWTESATWLIFVPVLGALVLAVAGSVCALLPNVM